MRITNKLVGKVLTKREYMHSFKVSPHNILIDKGENRNSMLETEGTHQVKKAITFNITCDKADRHNVPPDMTCEKEHSITSVGFLANITNLSIIIRKHQTHLNLGAVYQVTALNSSYVEGYEAQSYAGK